MGEITTCNTEYRERTSVGLQIPQSYKDFPPLTDRQQADNFLEIISHLHVDWYVCKEKKKEEKKHELKNLL